MKRRTYIVLLVLSILLVGLYTVTSTYSVIIEVLEKDGIKEIVNDITIKNLVTNDDGTYNDTYYMVKNELELTDAEADALINSKPLNEHLKTVLESIVDYKLNDNKDAKLTNNQIYNMITDGILKTNNITDELRSRVINKSSIYKEDISKYIYDIEVSLSGDIV